MWVCAKNSCTPKPVVFQLIKMNIFCGSPNFGTNPCQRVHYFNHQHRVHHLLESAWISLSPLHPVLAVTCTAWPNLGLEAQFQLSCKSFPLRKAMESYKTSQSANVVVLAMCRPKNTIAISLPVVWLLKSCHVQNLQANLSNDNDTVSFQRRLPPRLTWLSWLLPVALCGVPWCLASRFWINGVLRYQMVSHSNLCSRDTLQ